MSDMCDRCAGAGFIQVTQAYVDRVAPILIDCTEDEAKRRERERRRMAEDTYPCPECRPSMFKRWSGNHFDPSHDWQSCETCMVTHPAQRTRSKSGASREPLTAANMG